MNKFMKLLSADNNSIKGNRAKLIAEDLKAAQEEIVRNLQQEKRDIERKLLILSDFSPESELSLKVVRDGFDSKEWARNNQDLKVELANKTVEVKLAEETYNEWFTDDTLSE